MKAPVKIAATSYLNTIPFIYGIESKFFLPSDILLSAPNFCAEAYINSQVDIALVPIGALSKIHDAKIITPFCIGAKGEVRTVVLLSNFALEQITTIYIDGDSLSSAQLVKILCANYWKIEVQFKTLKDVDTQEVGSAYLMIGDKVFDWEHKFNYELDLSQQWTKFSSLPFVFAVWVARNSVDNETIDTLSQALDFGVKNIDKAIAHYNHTGKSYAHDYLTNNIDYNFDNDKRSALRFFSELSQVDDPPPSE